MAKLLVLLAAFAAVLLIAEASLKVTTVVIDDESSRGSCRQQMREQQDMRNCQQMMMRQVRGGRRGVERDRSFKKCCNEMKQMDSVCACKNLADMMRLMHVQGQMQTEDIRTAMGIAENLPRKCGMDSPGPCDFSSDSVAY